MQFIDPSIEQYCVSHTKREPDLLAGLKQETYEKMAAPQMLCGTIEGRLLKLLISCSRAKNVLEIGTFTGYSALSMAEALPADGTITTIDINEQCLELAQRYFDLSPHGSKIKVKKGNAQEILAESVEMFDFIFIDADKESYPAYYELCLPRCVAGGMIVFDNSLWGGKVLAPVDNESISIARLNELICRDERVENVLLPVRDGMDIVRKL